jgi:hypothetical protein
MATLYVRPTGPRPDFRLVLAFVWGDAMDCNTDGNSQHPADREWTELYAQNRCRPDEVFDVVAASDDPLILQVDSPLEWLRTAVAYLRAEASAGSVSSNLSGPFTPPRAALVRLATFDVQAAWQRYWGSPFQRSSVINPYPNLNP